MLSHTVWKAEQMLTIFILSAITSAKEWICSAKTLRMYTVSITASIYPNKKLVYCTE